MLTCAYLQRRPGTSESTVETSWRLTQYSRRRRAMSDAFFKKVFGDSEPTNVGSGWISGVLGVFFGLLGFGGALCLHMPALLTLPDARAHYPIPIIRLLIQGAIVLAIVLGAISALLRQR